MQVLPFVLILLFPQSPAEAQARAERERDSAKPQATRATLIKVPSGTLVEARLQSLINTNSSKTGNEVVAVLTKPISAGRVQVVPQGSRLLGRVETIAAASDSGAGRVRIVFREIEFPDGHRTQTWITDSFMASPPKRILRYFLYTGAGGAAGALIGGSRLRVGASLGGALTGFILAMNAGDAKLPDLTMRPGQILHLRLGEDLVS